MSDVTLRFGGVLALDSVSFEIQRGQIVGLIGPNGAGKTSFFNCVSRLYQPSSGSITFDGLELMRLKRHNVIRLGIARTFQNVALFPRMTVLDNVLVGDHANIASDTFASALRLGRARTAERAAHERALVALDVVGLRSQASAYCAMLPFPVQKRVELIRRIHDAFDLTVLLVEHHMNLVMSISDHVVVLSFGRKIAEGSPDEVRANPAVIEAYLGAGTAG